MLTGQQVQRLGSHIARNRPNFVVILRDFARRLAQAYPAAPGAFGLDNASARFDMAEGFALVCKSLHDLAPIGPYLQHAGFSVASRGLDMSAAPAAAAALLAAVRAHCTHDWSREIEADYTQLIDFVTAQMARGAARAPRQAQREHRPAPKARLAA